MPNTTVTKPKPATLKPRAHHSKRASSCSRCYYDNARDPVTVETRGRAPKEATRTRAAGTMEMKTVKTRKPPSELNTPAKTRSTACKESHLQPACDQPKTNYEVQSNKAFTVFAPNPKKRQDIQKKAEAELAALADLRLSQAVGYVSISPSSVGGCLTLEEVRIKQQQEMQIKRRQKQMKKHQHLETSPMVLA